MEVQRLKIQGEGPGYFGMFSLERVLQVVHFEEGGVLLIL